jgi:hypothetical protein
VPQNEHDPVIVRQREQRLLHLPAPLQHPAFERTRRELHVSPYGLVGSPIAPDIQAFIQQDAIQPAEEPEAPIERVKLSGTRSETPPGSHRPHHRSPRAFDAQH